MKITREDKDVPKDLLSYLQTYLSDKNIEFEEEPLRLYGGYDASTYSFKLKGAPEEYSGRLVFRLLQKLSPNHRILRESMYQNYLSENEFPAPKVKLICEENDRAFMIMEWITGDTLLSKLRIFPPKGIKFLKEMAQLQLRLHQIPHAPLRTSLKSKQLVIKSLNSELQGLDDKIKRDKVDSINTGLDWLKTHQLARPAADEFCICHGDLHPDNILLDNDSISALLDWSNATITEPEWDIAKTCMLLRAGPVSDKGWLENKLRKYLRDWACDEYLIEYARHKAINDERLKYYLAFHSFKAIFSSIHKNKLNGDGHPKESLAGRAWIIQESLESLRQIFFEASGITLSL